MTQLNHAVVSVTVSVQCQLQWCVELQGALLASNLVTATLLLWRFIFALELPVLQIDTVPLYTQKSVYVTCTLLYE